jgi:Glycosyl transferase family 90
MRTFFSARGSWLTSNLKYLILASLIVLCLTYILHFRSTVPSLPIRYGSRPDTQPQGSLPPYNKSNPVIEAHPIRYLIRQAQKKQEELLSGQPHNLAEAAANYRIQRGRHPPPLFDQWYAAAKDRDALIIETFFDRIYNDLNPFWAIDVKEIRSRVNNHTHIIRVRDHVVTFQTDEKDRVPWIQLWHDLVAEAALHLPDINIPINYMDESRVLVPWDKMTELMDIERGKRQLLEPSKVQSSYQRLQTVHIDPPSSPPNWIDDANKYWDHMRMCCPPDSPAYNVSAIEDFKLPIDFLDGQPTYLYYGYVQNWTQAKDPCIQPHLRSMHGSFIEPISMSTSHELLPLFSGSKLSMNNDILLPGAMYLSEEARFSGGELTGYDWYSKSDSIIWRGVGSGGRNKEDNWHHFQRHRFVQAVNGTTVSQIENGEFVSKTFKLPATGLYDIPAQRKGELGKWLSSFSDAAFVDLECYPTEYGGDDGKDRLTTCSYTNPYFTVVPKMPMAEQFASKYLPDIDGNSFSGRWRAFLMSTSLPMKATIYSEWHDDRLMPWVHFVPFDNTFIDFYGIMAYFLEEHDTHARRIAEEGRLWAKKVLRREDMLLYVWRLLLEFARICDDNRDQLGYVDDLIG